MNQLQGFVAMEPADLASMFNDQRQRAARQAEAAHNVEREVYEAIDVPLQLGARSNEDAGSCVKLIVAL